MEAFGSTARLEPIVEYNIRTPTLALNGRSGQADRFGAPSEIRVQSLQAFASGIACSLLASTAEEHSTTAENHISDGESLVRGQVTAGFCQRDFHSERSDGRLRLGDVSAVGGRDGSPRQV